MLGPAPKTIFYLTLFLCLVFTKGQAAAAQCSDIYPGSEIGPPPEWTFWGDGSACFVRWVPETPDHEKTLFEQCRNTPGVRFIHFERNKGAGHNICIFKIVNVGRPSADRPDANKEFVFSQPPLTEDRKSNAENPLGEIAALVTAWTEDCLKNEKAKERSAAGMCWKAAAKAIHQFTTVHEITVLGMESKLEQLRSTWLQRANQLDGQPVESTYVATTIEPASESYGGPDPTRLASTSMCSSTKLGDYRGCVGPAISSGNSQFAFSIKANCATGLIAAISTKDPKGNCIRRVISLWPDRSATVESYGEPAVLDAITFREGIHECYARRHENISCDGKTDYSDPLSQANAKRPSTEQESLQNNIKAAKNESAPAELVIGRAKLASLQLDDYQGPERKKKRAVRKQLPVQNSRRKRPAHMNPVVSREQPEQEMHPKAQHLPKKAKALVKKPPFLIKPSSSLCFHSVQYCTLQK